jgi:GTPase SAR1 family protein
MACCGSPAPTITPEQKAAIAESHKLDKALNSSQQEDGKILKLLLLGTGESGKSTIFKQMQILYQEGFSDLEKTTFKHVIRRNCVEAMQTLIAGVEKFGMKWVNPRSRQSAELMLKLDPLTADFWQQEIIEHIGVLWEEDAIKQAYGERSKLQLLDSSEYLFTNVKRIGKPDYVPSADDILRARLRTSGIVERMFKIKGVDFKFLDVGGQRNERRKWIHCFEGVTAMIFVVAISEFDQVLYEDEKKNRLVEALEVFENICNQKYFLKTVFILFLNKIDLFADKLKRKISLKSCFPDFQGNEFDFDTTTKYIEKQFQQVNKNKDRTIFVHLTCATDTKNVERVFEAAKRAILEKNVTDIQGKTGDLEMV